MDTTEKKKKNGWYVSLVKSDYRKKRVHVYMAILVTILIFVITGAIILCLLSMNSYSHITMDRNVPLGKGFGLLLTKASPPKVALCFYGQPRFYNSRTYTWIKKMILDVYHPDVFFHTWWSGNDVGKKYEVAPQVSNTIVVEPDVIDQLIALYNPVRFSYEPARKFPRPPKWVYSKVAVDCVPTNMMSMYYSLKRVRDIKRDHERENGFKYDWVIRMRFDVDIFSFPEIGDLTLGKYYEPRIWFIPCDSLSISSSEHFDTLGDMYKTLPTIWRNTKIRIFFEDVYTTFMWMKKIFRIKLTWRFKYIRNYLDVHNRKEEPRAVVKGLPENFVRNNYVASIKGRSFVSRAPPRVEESIDGSSLLLGTDFT